MRRTRASLYSDSVFNWLFLEIDARPPLARAPTRRTLQGVSRRAWSGIWIPHLLYTAMSFLKLARAFRLAGTRRFVSIAASQPVRTSYRALALGTTVGVATWLALTPHKIHLDSQVPESNVKQASAEDTTVDPATSIAFPNVMQIQSKTPIPPMSLVGVGVRTVSFIGLKVYSVGFYADLNNPAIKVPLDMSPENKVKYIVRNTSCVVRIIPTRSTNFTHLRDAFMRSLQARLGAGIKDGSITEAIAQSVSGPMRKLKSLFPNSPFAKHTPLDIYLAAPVPGKPRALVFRDLGTIEDDWVATELVLNYFEGEGPSPPLKATVLENLKSFEK
ncbi:unnamed protein product [Cyclocybe aegerita]|uniref:Chalcone isomerase domain-containing protein n=1 Tax=Cyclocybe aegerita TaxID=1973307 RepID=A0A8S0VQ64_CYCAE|nr:unnamed protein product [Cyclocybe aegerita]